MSSTQDSDLQQPSYEPYEPEMETQETADAHILLVRPRDFTRQQVGVYYEAAYRRIRVFGEKPIENNKRIRFSKEYTIPEDCDVEKLKGQFQEGAIITITIQKKPKEPEPEPEPEPAQEQEAAKQVTTTPQKSAAEVESEAADTKNGEKGVSEEKLKSEMESSQREADEKKDEKPTPAPEQEVTEESKMIQRDTTQEDQKNLGTAEKEKGSESGIPPKNQDQEGKGIPQEDDKNDKNQKKISEEGKASLQKDPFLAREKSKELEGNGSDLFIAYESSGPKKSPEREEKEELLQKDQRLEREKSKELEGNGSDLFIAYESSGPKKSPEREEKEELLQKDQRLEREKSKDEIPISAMDTAAKSYDIGLKKISEEEGKKQMGVQTDEVNEERSHENTVSSESSSIGKGMIKKMANSASEAVTRLANRFSEEDTQKKLLCAGAAILVVAVGIYASFKLRRSMTRQ